MIETPNLHKAEPEDSMTMGDSACMHCGVTVRLVPGGNGLVWVHDDGHVLGYNPTPTPTTLTIYFVGRTPGEALGRLPFNCWESAESYRLDEDEPDSAHVYAAEAVVQIETIRVVMG